MCNRKIVDVGILQEQKLKKIHDIQSYKNSFVRYISDIHMVKLLIEKIEETL